MTAAAVSRSGVFSSLARHWAIWREGLEQHLSVHEVNCRLYEQGLPLLGNANDE
jgi:hypothetical protein